MKRGDVRVHAPGEVEEDTSIRRNGHIAAEQMIERRHTNSGRVASLQWLRELTWVTDEDEVACGTRHRKHVGE